MLRPRIIPCLLVHQGGLVKTRRFKDPQYVGDPINAVKIFNEKGADELLVIDIDATVASREPNYQLIRKLAAECEMPLCYGGGVTSVGQAVKIVGMGVEKVAVSAAGIRNPRLLSEMAAAVGRQSVVGVLDIRKKVSLFGKEIEVCSHNGSIAYKGDPVSMALQFQEAGAGEVLINFVDRDGTMLGFDLDLAEKFRLALKIPITFLGGAGSLEDVRQLLSRVGVVGVAIGSLFLFKGKYKAVLISYPSTAERVQIFNDIVNR